MKQSLKSLPIDYRDYIFIDFGAGKGRVILLAADFPFKKIIGVEIFMGLAYYAGKNISVYRGKQQKCRDITCLCMNALDFEFPPEPLVCFLYNPFPKEIIEAWLKNIHRSLAEYPRKFWIIYAKPVFSSIFDGCGFLKIKARHISWIYDRWSYVIYSTK